MSVERIGENCEPALSTVMFMGGAGGSLRAGVTVNPVLLTRSVRELRTRVTCGGAPVYVWPGGGITIMADVLRMPDKSFGYVPTPALVAPIEFTMPRDEFVALGGYQDHVRSLVFTALRRCPGKVKTHGRFPNEWRSKTPEISARVVVLASDCNVTGRSPASSAAWTY